MDTIHPSLNLSIFSINGVQHDFFNCTREVRQGDSLSPILFFLVEEVLIRSIAKLVVDDSLKLIKSRKGTYIPSHVIYVDEILISFKGKISNIRAFVNLFNKYSVASGQIVNTTKSSIYSSSTPSATLLHIFHLTCFSMDSMPFIYIGVLFFHG